MIFTASILLIPGKNYNTLTTSDSGWVYDIAVEIDNANGFVDNNSLSHAPYGHPVALSEQGQPLLAVMLYRAVHAVNSNVTLMDVVRYWSPLLFALVLIPIFLIGKELGGDLAGCTAAFFVSALTGSVYWMKVGAFDREAIQLLLTAWTIYLTIRLFKAPPRSIPIFAVLGGLVYGLFGLSWGTGALYLAPVIVGGLVLCMFLGFVGKLIKGSKFSEAASLTGDENARLVVGVFGMMAVMGIIIYTFCGMGLSSWVGFIQILFGYVPISTGLMAALIVIGGGILGFICIRARAKVWRYAGCSVIIAICVLGLYSLRGMAGGAGVSFSVRYAGEMAAPGSWSETISGFYGADLLTYIALILVVLALIKICWSRKRWELIMLPWLVIIAGLVWPGRGQARFDRMWWPFIAVAAGTGVAALVSLFKWLSREPITTEWVKPLQKPVAIALCFSLVATPFIINAYAVAGNTTPPTEWHGFSGMDEALLGACAWLRENTPENSVVSIEWSFGHLLTGVSRRATVCDGTETAAEEGKWENDFSFTPRPPDYIYYVDNNTGYRYGLEVSARKYYVNGRRIDVQRFPLMSKDELRWILGTYQENFNVRIDYILFNYSEYYSAANYYYYTQPANILLSAERINTQLQSQPSFDGQSYVFNFGENRENVVFDIQNYEAYLNVDGETKYLDGCGILVVDNNGQISSYGGFNPPQTSVDIPETLLVFTDSNNGIIYGWLIDAVSDEISARPVPVGLYVFSGSTEDVNYIKVVYTSPNDLVKILKVNHLPELTSPTDNSKINDNTPTLQWLDAISAAKYELWVDNNSDFNSPEILENTSDTTYTPTTDLPDGIYSWRVRAFEADNRELGWTSAWAFTIDTVQPAVPTLVSPEDNRTDNVMTKTFTWTRPEPDTTYHLQISTAASFDPPYFHDNSSITENLYTFTFTAGGTYYWRVRAKDAAGNWGAWSENFKLTLTAPPGAPELYLPENGAHMSENTLTLEWMAGFYADNHRLLVDNDLDFSSPEVDNLFGLMEAWTVGPLAHDNYYWKVIGINAWGETSSPVWTFVIDNVTED